MLIGAVEGAEDEYCTADAVKYVDGGLLIICVGLLEAVRGLACSSSSIDCGESRKSFAVHLGEQYTPFYKFKEKF